MTDWIDHSHRGDCRDLMRAMIADGVRVQVAQRLGRRFLGCELNPDYESLQRDRLRQPGLALA